MLVNGKPYRLKSASCWCFHNEDVDNTNITNKELKDYYDIDEKNFKWLIKNGIRTVEQSEDRSFFCYPENTIFIKVDETQYDKDSYVWRFKIFGTDVESTFNAYENEFEELSILEESVLLTLEK